MNKIGFQNFRRFQNFAPLECGPITFLVGRNNAGKSTLVKALMLINNYLTSGSIFDFSIGENVLEEVNIVTFGRALHQPSNENFIRFFVTYDDFDIEITISGAKGATIAIVNQLRIIDTKNQIEFDYNFSTLTVKRKIIPKQGELEYSEILRKIDLELDKYQVMEEDVGYKKSTREYLEMIDFKNQLQSKKEDLLSKIEEKKGKVAFSEYRLELEIDTVGDFKFLFDNFIRIALAHYHFGFRAIQNNEEKPLNFESYRAFYEEQSIFESSIARFVELISNIKFVYLSANSSKQSALLSIRDKKNELAQSVHEHFTGLHMHDGFIKKWMKDFEVGEDFDIQLHAGEAYEVKILTEDGWIQLADMGLGSIQAMQLIFRIANILDDDMYGKAFSESDKLITVFIEEPELNLHPALQSKLADLFFEAFDKYKVRFIIETHSEYVLRRSQVLVAENDLEVSPNENPFCVYYFPKEPDQLPYLMKYQSDGVFNKNFGTGFFDTASLDTLKLLRIKREKNS